VVDTTTAQRAALDAQAEQRLERLGERDAAERRAGELPQVMVDRGQLSLRRLVACLDDPITIRSAVVNPFPLRGESQGKQSRDGQLCSGRSTDPAMHVGFSARWPIPVTISSVTVLVVRALTRLLMWRPGAYW